MNFWIWMLAVYAVIVTIVCFALNAVRREADKVMHSQRTENAALYARLLAQAEDIKVLQNTLRANCPPVEVEVHIDDSLSHPGKARPLMQAGGPNWEAMFVQCTAEKMQALREVARLKKVMNAQYGSVGATPKAFTSDEIKSLISLCHPDKHAGKDSAHRMTQRLLELRT